MKVYPIYLNRLNEKKTIIIGGDHEAERKVNELLECDANITVISPKISSGLKQLFVRGKFKWIRRLYQKGDLDGVFLVIVAQFEEDINQQVFEEANERGILINVMDDIPHCNFTFGSLVKRGPLTLSISTSGAAPTIAVRLRERFEQEFGEEYEQLLNFMRALRKPVADTYPDFQVRKEKWYKLVDSGILEHYRQKDIDKVREISFSIMGEAVVEEAQQRLNVP